MVNTDRNFAADRTNHLITMSSAEDSDTQPLNRKASVGQSNKVKPRELKAIQRGYSQIMSSIDLEK